MLAGLVEAAVYFAILQRLLPKLLPGPEHLYEILGPVLVLSPILLGKTAFIGFSSIAEDFGFPSELGDADREWWARWSGWILLSCLLWLGASALVFYAPFLLQKTVAKVSAAIAAGGLGGLISLLGTSAGTSAKESGEDPGLMRRLVLALAPTLFAAAVLLLVSALTQVVLRAVAGGAVAGEKVVATAYQGPTLVLLITIVLLLLIGIVLGRFVNVNRFSLQAMYRNRLVRAYLGASNPKRRPNLFTGFDPQDNLRLQSLRDNRPLPLINMTLNLVSGQDLAWQERKAESFTATPLHCGAANLGYRRSQVYGGEHGISLGTAVATSGAAANPNMGFNSSPAIAFIMTIFNARLGAWLGNPGPRGRQTYTRNGPRSSAKLLLDEAFGRTDSRHPYVNLSDGGHFDNFGLYELVRRRCRFIVVGDAGGDPKYDFGDLGNAIRKIRIDFGISIDFDDGIQIFPKPEGDPRPGAAYCAVGTVRYDSIDGKGTNGTLIYIKPTICGRASYDVYNYAKTSKTFPQESTADQWFSETQFESYRALARAAIREIVRKGPHPGEGMDLTQFEANVRRYLDLEDPASPSAAPKPEARRGRNAAAWRWRPTGGGLTGKVPMADKKIIAVIGATGAQGGGLARAILNDKIGPFAVRALTRNRDSERANALAAAGAEVVTADLDDEKSLERSFAGAYGAYCVTNFWEHFSPERELAQAANMARAAKAAGLQHVIWSTLEDTRQWVPLDDDRMPTLMGKYKVPHFDAKGEADPFFREAGVPTTFLLTTFYWDNFLSNAGPRRGPDGKLVLTLPMGDQKLAGIAVEDIGKCAYGIFKRGGELIGKTVGIAGEHLSGEEMAAALSRAVGEEVQYRPLPFDVYRNLGFPGAQDLGNMFQFYHDFSDYFLGMRDVDFARELNPELLSFDEWIRRLGDKIPVA